MPSATGVNNFFNLHFFFKIALKNQQHKKFEGKTEAEVVTIVKDLLTSACERDIYTGDYADIAVINKNGVRFEKFELKFD